VSKLEDGKPIRVHETSSPDGSGVAGAGSKWTLMASRSAFFGLRSRTNAGVCQQTTLPPYSVAPGCPIIARDEDQPPGPGAGSAGPARTAGCPDIVNVTSRWVGTTPQHVAEPTDTSVSRSSSASLRRQVTRWFRLRRRVAVEPEPRA